MRITVAISAELHRAVEAARKRRARSWSAVVREALQAWLGDAAHAYLVAEYEAGYRREPESEREVDAAMATALGLLRPEEDW